ncbi:nucleotide exchange factor GrpE [Sphaerisporangium sp. TRM90804]|uniref:nucleotide exchange factor GrpE n=1 Tax=Sphaerisporangium sp. TRM90804 TaxID=3031113 RepID=UPI002449BB7B|nr:nucleotide exchange factor GrpE [Sphaerisporangium sp. TRM90804]MDH2426765.1 nucleotide exchange factor GrpE [Sphaerisporangium sp. TRM90804]
MTSPTSGSEHEGLVIRDNRRIDPETGQVREGAAKAAGEPSPAAPAEPAADDGYAADLAAQLAERTMDLQRLQAEYANYRKRVERDRVVVREQAVANVLTEMLPVLDDIGRARDHGELTGGFAKVSEALESAVGKLGLTTYGTKGDAFDPTVHEALMHSYSAEVTEPTCVEILQPGYRIGDRVLRPARVAVAEPAESSSEAGEAPAEPEEN